MTGVFRKNRPPFGRVLLIESGSRQAADQFLQNLYRSESSAQVDLLTCFPTPPDAFEERRGQVFCVVDPVIAERRKEFIRAITATPYDIVAILSTGSGTLRKWKWIIGLLTRAKILIIKEGTDPVFLDYGSLPRPQLSVPRLRREQVTRLRLAGEMTIMPFTILFLLLYAGQAHLRRLLRSKVHTVS